MPLAPLDDPQRPIQLAVRTARILAVVLVILSCVMCLLAHGPEEPFGEVVMVMGVLFCIPAFAYFALAACMARRQIWVFITTLVVASLQGLVLLSLLIVVTGNGQPVLCLTELGLLALVLMLIVGSGLAWSALKEFDQNFKGPRGFEPIVRTPALPSESDNRIDSPHQSKKPHDGAPA